MAIIIDIIILGFIILSGFIGYKKGLSNIIINIIGMVLALLLAFMLKGTLASFIDSKLNVGANLKGTIADGINAAIETKLENSSGAEQKEVNESKKADGNAFYNSLVEKMHITDGVDAVATKVTKFILETASFIIIFMAVYLCVFIIKMMLNLVFKLPILSSINGIGGLVAATLIGVIQVWVVLAILSFLSPMLSGVTDLIDKTYVTKALYNINLIVIFLSNGLKF